MSFEQTDCMLKPRVIPEYCRLSKTHIKVKSEQKIVVNNNRLTAFHFIRFDVKYFINRQRLSGKRSKRN